MLGGLACLPACAYTPASCCPPALPPLPLLQPCVPQHPYPDSAAYLTGAIVLMSLGGALLVVAIVAWIRHRGLMFIPNVV